MGSESKDRIGERGGGRGREMMPAATRKVIHSLKEIVNCMDCTDQEIYAVLEECDMDPDRAVERLLAQDTFHEVKSKRERRKEMKEALDSRPRRSNVGFSWGGKTGSERNVVHSGSTHVTYNELGKATDKGEVGSACPSVTSSMTHVIGKETASDSFRDSRQQSGSAGVSSGLKPTILGVSKRHLSMADIVRMGKPSQDAVSHYHSKASGVSLSAKPEPCLSLHNHNQSGQQIFNHEWPVMENTVSGNESHASKLCALSNADVLSDNFGPRSDTESLLGNCVSEEAQVSQGGVDSDSRHTIMKKAGLTSHANYNLKSTSGTDSHGSSGHNEAASDFQRLSLRDSKLELLSTGDGSTLVLPDHVPDLTAKCSHLSFGIYNGGNNSTSSAMLASHLSSGLEEKAAAVDGGSLAQFLEASISARCSDKQLEHDAFKEAAVDKNYDFLLSCQQELVRRTFPEATLGHEYASMSSVPNPSFQKSQWVTPPLPFKRPDLQNGNTSTFSREMVMKSHFALPHRSALLQDLTVQSPLHLEQLADKRGYHPPPHNHRYMASVDAQQAFSGSSAYNHSLSDMKYSHPQTRSELFMSTLPPARGSDPFAFGHPGSSSYSPGSFLPNPSLGPMMPSSHFDENLPSQYNGGRNLSLIQKRGSFSTWDSGQESRSGSFSTWDNGLESRTFSLPESTRYGSLGQPSQALSQYITPGYSDPFDLRTGIAAELQQQSRFQDLSSKQSQQFGSTAANSLLSAHIMPPFFH